MQIAPGRSDICEFESSHPSHGVRSLWATCDKPENEKATRHPNPALAVGADPWRAAFIRRVSRTPHYGEGVGDVRQFSIAIISHDGARLPSRTCSCAK
jgi:hypothetical protein